MLPALVFYMASEEDDFFRALVFGKKKEIEDGRSYLMKERKPDKALRHFQRLVDQGYRGMYITRQHPNNVAKKIGTAGFKLVWLSTTLGRDYVDPHNLTSLSNLVNAFIKESRKCAILLDGLEYLMINNDFQRILKFIEYVNEMIMENRAILLLSVDDRAFESKELALLERNAVVME